MQTLEPSFEPCTLSKGLVEPFMQWATVAALWMVGASQPPTFGIVVGYNESTDPDASTLQYADDDALQYAALLEEMGAEVRLLVTPDEDTRRLYAKGLPGHAAPTFENLERAFDAFEAWRLQHPGDSVLYFIYAGHGDVRHGEGYLTLADGELSRSEFYRDVLDRANASVAHVIIDACKSYFMVFDRDGQKRTPHRRRFAHRGILSRWPHIGFVLSTSSAKNSHEWEAFQAGVFSHEVRSALRGAADANRDGEVSYRELLAFVTWANRRIPNVKYAPEVIAAPPLERPVLSRLGGRPQLTLDEALGQHVIIETASGVRVADVRVAEPIRLNLPPGRLYLRYGQQEYALTGGRELTLSTLEPQRPRVRSRGAEHEAFRLLFADPFSAQALEAPLPLLLRDPDADPADYGPKLSGWFWAGLGTSLALGGAAAGFKLYADEQYARFPSASNDERPVLQDRIDRSDRLAIANASMAAVTAAVTMVLYSLDVFEEW